MAMGKGRNVAGRKEENLNMDNPLEWTRLDWYVLGAKFATRKRRSGEA